MAISSILFFLLFALYLGCDSYFNRHESITRYSLLLQLSHNLVKAMLSSCQHASNRVGNDFSVEL